MNYDINLTECMTSKDHMDHNYNMYYNSIENSHNMYYNSIENILRQGIEDRRSCLIPKLKTIKMNE